LPQSDVIMGIHRPDGTLTWISINVQPIFKEGETRPYRVVATMRDITERRHAEAQLRLSASVFENATEGIMITDKDSNIISVNQAFTQITGYEADEAIGKNPRLLASGAQTEKFYEEMWNAIAASGRWQGEIWDKRKSGEPYCELLSVSAILDEQGGISHYCGIFSDITARKQTEAAHAMLEAQLRESQKMEAIGTLAGGIAHDFNNIIAAILGNTELALEDVSSNTRARESIEEIRKAARRGRDVVQQILAFSRRQPIERSLTALIPIVDESVRLLRATLPARISLEVHCDADVPPVLADATQIQQVLINLATNAMQAMQGKPGRIDIRLDTVMLDAALAHKHPELAALYDQQPGRAVRLAVSDDAAGMDAATLAKIFEPFFTTKPAGEGTGLGLSVVYGIVRTHEGAIAVDTAPGKGTTFTIYLPVAKAQAGAPAPAVSVTTAAPRLDSDKHILYLDDDEALVFLVKRLLGRHGYRVSGYTNQTEALAALRADPASFDLVVTDYNMPAMSGLDVAREVRSIRADLPVAVVSGFIDEELRTQAGVAGVRDLIFKANATEDMCEAFMRLAQMVGQTSRST
jgi:two-component system cell cycle sensor histidine kinase/response regulator CckA